MNASSSLKEVLGREQRDVLVASCDVGVGGDADDDGAGNGTNSWKVSFDDLQDPTEGCF